MSGKVFISGSISIKKLPESVKESIHKIAHQNIEILVGDADGIDTLVQSYCKSINYNNVSVYSIYSSPRYKVKGFNSEYIVVTSESKKERERQREKDEAMTLASEFSLVIWDGKSKGSYTNIMRALDNNKKVKVYIDYEGGFLDSSKITKEEIEYIFRKNTGYSASEVVEYLISEGETFFQTTRELNKCLLDNKIIQKEEGVYTPFPDYKDLFILKNHRGKVTGLSFTVDFIGWVEKWVKTVKPPEDLSLF